MKGTKVRKTQLSKGTPKSSEEGVDDNLLQFLIYHLKYISYNKFDSTKFSLMYKIFFDYLSNYMFSIFYFSPLHNFTSQISRLDLSKDTWIRRPTPIEVSVISDLINGQKEKIDVQLMDLRFIICTNIQKKDFPIPIHEAKNRFHEGINVLKIFSDGDIELGGFYSSASENWLREGPSRVKPEIIFYFEN